MIEIIATVYITSFLLSWLISFGYVFFVLRRQLKSRKLQVLDFNLSKVQLFWSNQEGAFAELTEGSREKDHQATYRSFLKMSLFFSFLSFLGFLFIVVFVISLRFLARPRLEIRTFSSRLAQDRDLSAQDVALLVQELKTGTSR